MNVIVTDAAGALGRVVAGRFAREGTRLPLIDRMESEQHKGGVVGGRGRPSPAASPAGTHTVGADRRKWVAGSTHPTDQLCFLWKSKLERQGRPGFPPRVRA